MEYRAPLNQSRRPLYNAVKYATSFPVIYLSAAQRIVVSDLAASRGAQVRSEPWHGEHQLFRLWLLAALINSLYSYWWDLTNDWGFDLLRSKSTQGEDLRPHPFGLRTRLLYPLSYYPFIVLANLVLRLTWSVKLSPHLHSHSEGSGVIFWTEVAELVRRWMWVFLRVEWEIVKEKQETLRAREYEMDIRED
ncbi:EXS-domain-containing protein [Thelephora ganbajun]|uniref:EXS-domain-containing protein n=1 Tax=Thelephora ganbajun TaxID=370292 RepID=A0ACB6ZNV3_THEGA|nr:EXS-domain-containing protein [Thelephora ganbajun]